MEHLTSFIFISSGLFPIFSDREDNDPVLMIYASKLHFHFHIHKFYLNFIHYKLAFFRLGNKDSLKTTQTICMETILTLEE